MEVYSTLTQEHDTSVPIAIGAISAVILVAVAVAVIVVAVFFRKRICRESRRVKSKPIPMPRRLNYTGEEEPSHTGAEDVEMKDICADDEKDDYYFEDPSNIVTGRNDIHEDDFSDHVKQMHQERNHKFELEYKSLEKLTNAACDVACLSCNLTQNRFKNIYPYDHTRVELKKEPKVEGSDYINASFIDGYPDKKHVYIASQGPTEQSVERFWRMVWEYQLTTIVMLTRCVEDGKEKCAKYWPDQVHGTLNIGSKFIVTLTSIIPSAEYQIRKLQVNSVSDPNRDMTVTHMHYTAWPDHGVPQNAMSVISFIRRVRREHPHCLDQPLLVHCSAGVGRTGTFILLDTVMQQMKNEGTLSIYNVLKNVRDQRMKMVQTKAQYVFIHDALSELVVCGETDIPVASIRINISQLQKLIVGEAITGFQKQFKTMEQMSSQYQASYIEAEAEHNVEKNRFPDKLPNEASRVRLRYGTQPGSDYINASFIDGYKHRRAYIAAQGPLQNTVNDFWRMVWEHHCSCIVLLCDTEENNMDGCHCFWPNGLGGANMDGAEEVYGKMTVTLKRQSFYGDIIEWKLEVTENDGKGSTSQRMVTLLKLTSWPIDELPHPSSILSLIDLLGKAQRSSPSRHTVIMCSDGVGRTGSFICIHSQLERLKTEGVVDFFQGAKSARIQRAGLIPDDVHYAFCHEVVASYVDSFETYANFKEVV